MRVLLVEDDPVLSEAVVEALQDDAYAVDLAADGERASELMDVNSYDLVLLDWAIPGPSGMELLRGWRAAGVRVPVLMLTGRAGIEDRVSGLDSGADDYLSKPFALSEMLARVRSLLRRRERPLLASLTADDLEVDRAGRRVTVGGEPVELTPKEFTLLEYLLGRRDEVVTRTELIEHVWDDSFDSLSNVVDVTMYRLRRKVDGGREKKLLHTVKGVGYLLKSERS